MTVTPLRERRSRPAITRLRVTTGSGVRTTTLSDDETTQPVAVAPGPTTWIRLSIDGVSRVRGVGAGLREVALEGLRIDRTVSVPRLRASDPTTFLFERSRSDPYDLGRTDEEAALRRRFVTERAGAFELSATASGRPGRVLDQLVAASRGTTGTTTASST